MCLYFSTAFKWIGLVLHIMNSPMERVRQKQFSKYLNEYVCFFSFYILWGNVRLWFVLSSRRLVKINSSIWRNMYTRLAKLLITFFVQPSVKSSYPSKLCENSAWFLHNNLQWIAKFTNGVTKELLLDTILSLDLRVNSYHTVTSRYNYCSYVLLLFPWR